MIFDFTGKTIEIEDRVLLDVENILGYTFSDKKLLALALMHSSRANELSGNPLDSNERLEFLGDAVLEEIISIYLYRQMPDKLEGVLTKTRAQIVCEESLANAAMESGLNRYLMLGKGEETSGGHSRDSITSDGIEALIGAVYLDGGQNAARALIFRLLGAQIEMAMEGRLGSDAKTSLQEKLQTKGSVSISYRIIDEEGPAHDKRFTAAVIVDGKEAGRGMGRSKQAAESAAASEALRNIGKNVF